MKRLILAVASVAMCGVLCAANDQAQNKPRPRRGEGAMKRVGGHLNVPNSQKGKIVVFNAQKKVALADYRAGMDQFAQDTKFKVEYADCEAVTPANASDIKEKGGANVAVFLVECDKCPNTMLVAPDARWAIVNVAAVTKDAKNGVFAAARTRKVLLRAFLCAAGAMDSQYNGSMMSPIKTPADLDKIVEDPPLDAMMRAEKTMRFVGLAPLERTTYLDACQEGWAPQPTNEYQKAIWDQVHAVPSDPIKIKFDPKTGK